MKINEYPELQTLIQDNNNEVSKPLAQKILSSNDFELLPLLETAFQIRKKKWKKKVRIHILNNAKNGNCPEDCSYCVQGKKSTSGKLEDYPMKSDEEILAEAEKAYQAGAYRYCMVFAGRGPSDKRVQHLSNLIKKIKSNYPLEICVSPGLLKEGQAETLKEAGLDRLNHNLNTTELNYTDICTTHSFQDRLKTLEYARNANLDVCSGMILGMGEGPEGVYEIFKKLSDLKAASIPVNFLIPIEGAPLGQPENLTPEYCLRVLCLARFMNPEAEIRAAGGREYHLRGLQSLALYPANSIFMDGYLNVIGQKQKDTLQMILDAGFEVDCDEDVNIRNWSNDSEMKVDQKGEKELRPQKASI